MRAALATPSWTRLKVKMEMKVGKRSAPISPMKATTCPRVSAPARQSSRACRSPAAQADRKDQHGPVARLDDALPDEVVAVAAGVAGELAPLVVLLRRCLDHLDAGDGLGQPGVHGAELLAHGHADRLEPAVVVADRDGQQHGEDAGHQQQPGVEPADEQDRHRSGQRRVDDQHQARAEHRVEHAHVVGGAGHDVADALAAVEGLALAQQAGVQLVAGVALDALGQELDRRSCAPAPVRPWPTAAAQDAQRQRQQRGRAQPGAVIRSKACPMKTWM